MAVAWLARLGCLLLGDEVRLVGVRARVRVRGGVRVG